MVTLPHHTRTRMAVGREPVAPMLWDAHISDLHAFSIPYACGRESSDASSPTLHVPCFSGARDGVVGASSVAAAAAAASAAAAGVQYKAAQPA
jgi:hypothetical protein